MNRLQSLSRGTENFYDNDMVVFTSLWLLPKRLLIESNPACAATSEFLGPAFKVVLLV